MLVLLSVTVPTTPWETPSRAREEHTVSMTLLVAFWGVSLLMVLMPGADWAYAIRAGISDRTVWPAVSGMLAGHTLVIITVAAGVAGLIAHSQALLATLMVLGAAYLIWLGIGVLRHPTTAPVATDDVDSTGSPRWPRIVKGFGVSGLNPKVLLLFLALLPQFTDPSGTWPLAIQIAVLGGAHLISCAVVYSAVGLLAKSVLRSRPTSARIVSLVSGAVMIALGIVLLIERIPPLFD